jgi:hypothetical protein
MGNDGPAAIYPEAHPGPRHDSAAKPRRVPHQLAPVGPPGPPRRPASPPTPAGRRHNYGNFARVEDNAVN